MCKQKSPRLFMNSPIKDTTEGSQVDHFAFEQFYTYFQAGLHQTFNLHLKCLKLRIHSSLHRIFLSILYRKVF